MLSKMSDVSLGQRQEALSELRRKKRGVGKKVGDFLVVGKEERNGATALYNRLQTEFKIR
jgi:hypothetical protein